MMFTLFFNRYACALCQLPVVEALWTWLCLCGATPCGLCRANLAPFRKTGLPSMLRGPARLPCHVLAVLLDFPYRTCGKHSLSMIKKFPMFVLVCPLHRSVF